KLPNESLTVEFIYSYKDVIQGTRYLSLYNTLEFKENNKLNYSDFLLAQKWENNLNLDYSKSLDDILKDIYKKSNYKVIWSAN
ncbi:TcpJ, partial [Clostridium perfringens]|nr:TcpJ [Clostridium perfringens]